MRSVAQRRHGLSFLEIVIVVMILGLIASIALPKLLGTSQQAVDNGLRHSLSVIRAAIDSYSAEKSDKLPGANGVEQTFKDDLVNYLRGAEFPTCPVGAAKNNAVRMMAGTGSVASTIGATAATHSWVYKYETGEFHVNSVETSEDGVTTYDQF
jgi:prepilin-type N-terminal cleavage/methylation domain-containing protein